MSDEQSPVLWVTVGDDDYHATAEEMENISEQLGETFEGTDYNIVVTDDSVDTITADQASEIIQQLTDALEGHEVSR